MLQVLVLQWKLGSKNLRSVVQTRVPAGVLWPFYSLSVPVECETSYAGCSMHIFKSIKSGVALHYEFCSMIKDVYVCYASYAIVYVLFEYLCDIMTNLWVAE